jgi:hypothetical protein
MPGAIPHLIAGSAMFFIGRYYFKSYFDGDNKLKEKILLAFICLLFSILPDFILVIYYTTHVLPFCTFLPFHDLVHIIFSPIAIIILLILKFKVNTKREPIWIMGLWCIILHIVMDLFLSEHGVLL